jgi:hypothetical protein
MFMRTTIRAGFTPEIFFGRIDVKALRTFVDGIGFYTFCCGVKDEPFGEFLEWLRAKGEYVDPDSWEGRYLKDCDGDHRAAIMKFLDRCAEFVAQRQPPDSGAPR